jgi:hypothetical protein
MAAHDLIADIGHWCDFDPMKQMTDADVLTEVRAHTIGNRREIDASKFAGCVSCCVRFDAREIVAWQDEWNGSERQNRARRWTAKCPRCGQPSVIGSASGLLDDPSYEPVVKLIVERASQR